MKKGFYTDDKWVTGTAFGLQKHCIKASPLETKPNLN